MQNFYFYSTAIQFELIFSRVAGGLADFFGAEADFFVCGSDSYLK